MLSTTLFNGNAIVNILNGVTVEIYRLRLI